MPWGGWYHPGEAPFVDTKPPAGAGGLKTQKYSGEQAKDVQTSSATSGSENIAGAGTIYAPELLLILEL
jgi:hypothetical protein